MRSPGSISFYPAAAIPALAVPLDSDLPIRTRANVVLGQWSRAPFCFELVFVVDSRLLQMKRASELARCQLRGHPFRSHSFFEE
jgi:hypothetical protein